MNAGQYGEGVGQRRGTQHGVRCLPATPQERWPVLRLESRGRGRAVCLGGPPGRWASLRGRHWRKCSDQPGFAKRGRATESTRRGSEPAVARPAQAEVLVRLVRRTDEATEVLAPTHSQQSVLEAAGAGSRNACQRASLAQRYTVGLPGSRVVSAARLYPGCVRNTQDRDAACKRCGCRREPRIATIQATGGKAREGARQPTSIFTLACVLVLSCSGVVCRHHAGYVFIGRRCRHRRASFGSWAAASEQPVLILGLHVCPAKRQAWSAVCLRQSSVSACIARAGVIQQRSLDLELLLTVQKDVDQHLRDVGC